MSVLINIIVLVALCGGLAIGSPLVENSNRIHGGDDAPTAYAPHMVALVIDQRMFLCGGSIITTRLVLTAAHCIEVVITWTLELDPSLAGRIGSNNWRSGGTLVKFSTYYNHPEYDRYFIKNDIGVLVLEHKLVLNKFVQTIALNFDFFVEEKCFATGWGVMEPLFVDNVVHLAPTPDNLQLLYVETIDHERCQRVMEEVRGDRWTPPIQKDVEICTLHSPGYGMCHGDSGSALVKADTREQIGVVSWGLPCAHGAPDVFVRIAGVKKFLKNILDRYRE